MKKLFFVLIVFVLVFALQSCEAETTEESFIIENAETTSDESIQAVDPDEVEDPDDRGNG